MNLRRGVERHSAEDSREAEHILRFKERAIRVTIHLHCDHVVARPHMLGDVKHRSITGVLGEADILAVDPEVEERIDTIELDEDFTTIPIGIHDEGAAMGAYLVTRIVSHPVLWWLTHDAALPVVDRDAVLIDHRLITVDRCAVFLILFEPKKIPVRWHGDVIPAGYIERWLKEILRAQVRVLHPAKLPLPVQ